MVLRGRYLRWSKGGGTEPLTQAVWSSTMLMVRFGCQWEMISTGPWLSARYEEKYLIRHVNRAAISSVKTTYFMWFCLIWLVRLSELTMIHLSQIVLFSNCTFKVQMYWFWFKKTKPKWIGHLWTWRVRGLTHIQMFCEQNSTNLDHFRISFCLSCQQILGLQKLPSFIFIQHWKSKKWKL